MRHRFKSLRGLKNLIGTALVTSLSPGLISCWGFFTARQNGSSYFQPSTVSGTSIFFLNFNCKSFPPSALFVFQYLMHSKPICILNLLSVDVLYHFLFIMYIFYLQFLQSIFLLIVLPQHHMDYPFSSLQQYLFQPSSLSLLTDFSRLFQVLLSPSPKINGTIISRFCYSSPQLLGTSFYNY